MTETFKIAEAETVEDMSFGEGRRLRPTEERYLEILDFLWEEAAVLDRDNLTGWQTMLDRRIRYA